MDERKICNMWFDEKVNSQSIDTISRLVCEDDYPPKWAKVIAQFIAGEAKALSVGFIDGQIDDSLRRIHFATIENKRIDKDAGLLHALCEILLHNEHVIYHVSDYREQHLWGLASKTEVQKFITSHLFENIVRFVYTSDLCDYIRNLLVSYDPAEVSSLDKLLIAITCGVDVLRNVHYGCSIRDMRLDSSVPVRMTIECDEIKESNATIQELTGLSDAQLRDATNEMINSYRRGLPDGKGRCISTEDALRIFMYTTMKGVATC